MQISALIQTRNEERYIAECLKSLQWADEIVVADMSSTDRTREIAASMGARIVDVPTVDYVDKVRNLSMAACKGDWILVVDCDETVPESLAARLRELANESKIAGYSLPRRNYFLGQWARAFWPDYQVRFFRNGAASWSGVVHHLAVVKGAVEQLPAEPRFALEHPGYGDDLQKFLRKLVYYSFHEVERLKQQKIAPFPYIFRRPFGEFYGRYFRGGGWRDGMPGLVLSLLLANYQLLNAIQYWAATRKPTDEPEPAKLRRAVRREILRGALNSWRQ